MQDLSLHILDIAENSVNAGARNIRILINEDYGGNMLTIEISDDGRGMEPAFAARAADPFTTTRSTRNVGLGLALLRQSAAEAGGGLRIDSEPGAGTTVIATFRLNHIDRKPLGCMADTIATLVGGWPDIDIRYAHIRDGHEFVFDTKAVRDRLGGVPINNANALNFIRQFVQQEEETLT